MFGMSARSGKGQCRKGGRPNLAFGDTPGHIRRRDIIINYFFHIVSSLASMSLAVMISDLPPSFLIKNTDRYLQASVLPSAL